MANSVVLPLKAARKLGEKIVTELAPFCAPGYCVLAGSVRRGKERVGDIDLVCIPTDRDGLRRRVMQAASHEMCSGEQVFRVLLKTGVQLDIYYAHAAGSDLVDAWPSNWGTVLLCRTGSAAHNVVLCQRAETLGMKWEPHKGLFARDGECLASETEQDIFKALKMAYLAPEKREA